MQVLTFGSASGQNAMGIPVAFSNAVSLDLTEVRRLVWVSGQLSFDSDNRFVGAGDMRAQTEQCLLNMRHCLEQLGRSLAFVFQVPLFVREMSQLAAIHEVRLRYFQEPLRRAPLVQVSGFVHPE